jgi:hypothetical protein
MLSLTPAKGNTNHIFLHKKLLEGYQACFTAREQVL